MGFLFYQCKMKYSYTWQLLILWYSYIYYIFNTYINMPRVHFTLSTFIMIWKDTIFTVISILNFLKSTSRQIFTKTKRLNGSKTIVFDFNIIFVFINVWLPLLLKKFNMDITEKMVSFQIIQNVLILKRTLYREVDFKVMCEVNYRAKQWW